MGPRVGACARATSKVRWRLRQSDKQSPLAFRYRRQFQGEARQRAAGKARPEAARTLQRQCVFPATSSLTNATLGTIMPATEKCRCGTDLPATRAVAQTV